MINLFPRSREGASVYLMPFGVDDEHLVSLLRNQDTARFYWDSHIVLRETEFSLWKPSGYGPFTYTKRGLSHPKICLSNSRRNYLMGGTPGRPGILSWPPATHASSSSWASGMMITHRHDSPCWGFAAWISNA